MGNSMSDWLELQVLNGILGATSWAPTASSWLALFTTPPTDSTTGVELNGGGYTRVAIQNNTTNWPNATTGTKQNGTAFEFPTATTAWGNVSAFALFDAAAAGDCLFFGTAAAVKAVASGDVVRWASGSLVIQLD
jgi:hypothetical protein